ncbi:hypothetical protein QJV03_01220 [Listeria swaminathanii]|uniref:Uncharacterized protein n=2 Tax=Listeria TaxID=1637 RepID=A0ABU2IE03_9LIST|nr:hypothetical protein [Listeria swaminathanii]MDT0015802.1 hypothetical protein [Listeria swaminathanii]MDT0021238.1 hypothetical protein [Listeria swaminathanii]MDT0032202.1 hypothetical protein [Listeria swaminathanii]MDT0051948.1 hypothetical protein [Listeria swaminathanii]MDT0054713.1 hypothetical protein [Listeria swaminathanii]
MNKEIIQLYKNFDNNKLPLFFEKLILFINNHDKIFRKYILEDSLNSIEQFKESEFYLGTTDDNLEGLALGYSETLIGADEKEICGNVIHMIWDIATFMTDELCPSCQDANLKIASSTDRNNIYKTCDNCLITMENGQFIERPKEMIPATKEQINS